MTLCIETERIKLRDFSKTDFPFYRELETDQYSLEFEADSPPEEAFLYQKFMEMLELAKEVQRTKYYLLAERKEDGAPLGKVVIWQIDKAIDEWELGWVLRREHAGKGYASEAARALIELGFTRLGANRICANCNQANLGSERVMQKAGMQKEGVLRETRKLGGRWYGSCIYSILKREYAG